MKAIFVINSAGETVAQVGWENLDGDSALLGGFISALQMFIKKIVGDEISELQFGNMILLIGRVGDNYVVTLHSVDDKKAKENHRVAIDLILDQGDDIDDGTLALINEMLVNEK